MKFPPANDEKAALDYSDPILRKWPPKERVEEILRERESTLSFPSSSFSAETSSPTISTDGSAPTKQKSIWRARTAFREECNRLRRSLSRFMRESRCCSGVDEKAVLEPRAASLSLLNVGDPRGLPIHSEKGTSIQTIPPSRVYVDDLKSVEDASGVTSQDYEREGTPTVSANSLRSGNQSPTNPASLSRKQSLAPSQTPLSQHSSVSSHRTPQREMIQSPPTSFSSGASGESGSKKSSQSPGISRSSRSSGSGSRKASPGQSPARSGSGKRRSQISSPMSLFSLGSRSSERNKQFSQKSSPRASPLQSPGSTEQVTPMSSPHHVASPRLSTKLNVPSDSSASDQPSNNRSSMQTADEEIWADPNSHHRETIESVADHGLAFDVSGDLAGDELYHTYSPMSSLTYMIQNISGAWNRFCCGFQDGYASSNNEIVMMRRR